LFFLLWQIKPSEWRSRPEPALQLDSTAEPSKLDEIAQKETLSKRKDTILHR